MTDIERAAHVVVSHMTITEKEALQKLAGSRQLKKPRISDEMLGTLMCRDLVSRDKYDSLIITDLGSAALRHIRAEP